VHKISSLETNSMIELRRSEHENRARAQMSLRKVLKNKAAFPSDQALKKILFLAIRNISKKWSMPIRDWGQAINQFAILHPERMNFE